MILDRLMKRALKSLVMRIMFMMRDTKETFLRWRKV